MGYIRESIVSRPPLQGRSERDQRLDVHNSNVDQAAAEEGRCGATDLNTGRTCRQPALHRDGCIFDAAQQDPGVTDHPARDEPLPSRSSADHTPEAEIR